MFLFLNKNAKKSVLQYRIDIKTTGQTAGKSDEKSHLLWNFKFFSNDNMFGKYYMFVYRQSFCLSKPLPTD